MTTSEAIDYFLILQDKYGSPDAIPDEVVDFLNHATNEYLNRCVPDNQGGMVNFEQDKNVIANLQPLIYVVDTSPNGSGLISNSALNTLIQTATGDPSSQYFRVMSIGAVEGDDRHPVKYVRQNNIWEFEQNYFKRPSTGEPKWTLVAGGLQVYPKTDTLDLTIAVLKKPRVLSLSPVVNPEFEDYVMYNIVAIALQFAGVATRDEEIITDLRNITAQAK